MFESDKFILIKGSMYVGNDYVFNGLFKANAVAVYNQSAYFYEQVMNKIIFSVYLFESSFLWHNRLGYVNRASLRKLVGLELIPNLESENKHKCEICVKAKFV